MKVVLMPNFKSGMEKAFKEELQQNWTNRKPKTGLPIP